MSFCEIFKITDLQFMHTDEDMVRHYSSDLNENIGLILGIFNSFAFKRIVLLILIFSKHFKFTNTLKNMYISGTMLRLTKSDWVFDPFGLFLDSD